MIHEPYEPSEDELSTACAAVVNLVVRGDINTLEVPMLSTHSLFQSLLPTYHTVFVFERTNGKFEYDQAYKVEFIDAWH